MRESFSRRARKRMTRKTLKNSRQTKIKRESEEIRSIFVKSTKFSFSLLPTKLWNPKSIRLTCFSDYF